MNATVTRSVVKRATAKKAGTTSEKKTAVPAAAVSKTPSGRKNTPAATKSIAKPAQSTVKSRVKTAAKSAARKKSEGVASKAAPPVADAAPASKKAATNLKQSPTAGASKVGSKETSGASMSGNNASAGLMDTMEKPAVSKVSEVATKTTKSTPAVSDGTLLTEAQILQMTEKDYMNEAQLAFFKARLQQLERDLLKNAGETTEHLRETVLVPDPADRATIEEEHALELRTRDRERKLLKKVQQSIASIDAGEYGWCEETGEPIGIPRLLARPTATLSLEAQQRRELKQKLYGD
nr:RNA polymerase-binding protein DksA [Noviherbaspirillum saxi]